MKEITQIWMIRSGEQGYLFEDFLSKKVVAIGWNDIGDLAHIKKPEEIKLRLRKAYPDLRQGQIDNIAGQINRFRFEIGKGEHVVTYNPSTRTYQLGKITSDYRFDKDVVDFYHIREVEWQKPVLRDALKIATKNSLGSTLTIFKLNGDSVIDLLQNDTKTAHPQSSSELMKLDEELDELKEDIESKAREFIKDKIIALEWDKMQDFVAGLLRAMGYKSFVSPKGMDRGRDIVASVDGLGLEDPKVVVEVKHRKGPMTSENLRSFIGGMRPSERGVYVSTGGFTKDARYEAERSDKPLTIVDSDRLVTLLIEYYDRFDVDTRLLIPLKKLYWPL